MDVVEFCTSDWHDKKDESKRLIIYFIPGNPGLCIFYETFFSHLIDQLNEQHIPCAIRCVSHLGHCLTPTERRYSVEEQIRHHHAYLRAEILPSLTERDSLIIMGHSIGAYIGLQLLYAERQQASASSSSSSLLDQLVGFVGLFPTIERMAVSPQGRKLRRYFHPPLLWLVLLTAFLLHWFVPENWKRSLLRRYFSRRQSQTTTTTPPSPPCVQEGVLRLMRPAVIWQVFHMAHSEMQQVKDLQEDTLLLPLLREHNVAMALAYTASDKWAPREYYDNVTHLCPDVRTHLYDDEENGPEHAFVMQHNHTVANYCVNFLRSIY